MKDNKKSELGTISFLDVDSKSGKILEIEEDETDMSIPEIVEESEIVSEMTPEMQSIVDDTYVADQEASRLAEEKAKEESNKKIAKIFLVILVILGIILYSIYSYSSINYVNKQKDVLAKTSFLENNAIYANNIKEYFKNLTNNADNYQKNVINEYSMKNKATSIYDNINKEMTLLLNKKDEFTKYDAETLYEVVYARLNEARNLAQTQKAGGKALDLVYKTNEFILNENDNANVYSSKLKEYLDKNDIPYREESGKLIYSTDDK